MWTEGEVFDLFWPIDGEKLGRTHHEDWDCSAFFFPGNLLFSRWNGWGFAVNESLDFSTRLSKGVSPHCSNYQIMQSVDSYTYTYWQFWYSQSFLTIEAIEFASLLLCFMYVHSWEVAAFLFTRLGLDGISLALNLQPVSWDVDTS